MARFYTSINSFADAEAFYNKIVPLRGRKSEGRDIRPLGDRRRKWERIVKVSRNCYALTNGWHPGEDDWWMYVAGAAASPKDMAFYSPIVWRRHRDGTETVTVRNGTGPGQHNGVYDFLHRHLPRYMRFRMGNGTHFIGVHGTEYYLAKGRTVPNATYKRLVGTSYDSGWYQTKDDKASLTFKVLDGRYELVGDAMAVPKPPKKRVDKALKAELKPHLDAFRDWAIAITPMLPTDWQYERTVLEEARTVPIGDFRLGYSAGYAFNASNYVLARQVLIHEFHQLRLLLALHMRIHVTNTLSHQPTRSEFNAAFNRWANRTFGLINTVQGDAE